MPPTQANVTNCEFQGPEGGRDGGLLEQPALRVGPADARGRRLLWGPTGRLVGVCFRQRRPWWLRWLRPGLDVYEAGDQPLVFSVQPALTLGSRQVVRDAEGDLVGTTDRRHLRDRWGRPRLRQRPRGDGRSGELVGPDGQVAARWSSSEGELTLDLSDGSLTDPFERMLALTSLLSLTR